jgi:hypothetical protein
MLHTTRTQLDQLKVPCQDLKRFRNDCFRNEVVEGGTEQKKAELVLAETELNNYIKVNFEDLETCFDFN